MPKHARSCVIWCTVEVALIGMVLVCHLQHEAVTGSHSYGGNPLDGLVVLFVHLGGLAIAMNLLKIRVID